MVLYVNGDSHSAGTDAGGITNSYGQYLANILNMNLVCDAMPGGSNTRIIRTTREYLKNNKPELVVIGWTTWEREEWYSADQNYYQVSASGFDKLPEYFHKRYKEWVIQASSPNFIELSEYRCHNEIYQLHCDLKLLNISHLFFNTYLYFQYTVDRNLLKFDWGNNYVDPYQKSSTFYYWLTSQNYKPNKKLHFGKDAQKAWADKLFQDLTNIR